MDNFDWDKSSNNVFAFPAKQVVGPPWSGGGPQPFSVFFLCTRAQAPPKKYQIAGPLGQRFPYRSGPVAKIRASMLSRTHSEETRKKIGESMGTSVKITDTETGITTIYPSKRQVARELNTSLDTVRRYIISGIPFKGKYLIEN